MADFNEAIVLLLKHEGGYQADPNDPGNYDPSGNLIGTNFGITPKTYDRYYGSYPTATQIKALSYIAAMDVYKALYWDYYNLGSIPSQAVANQVLDTLVLHGRGARLIQNTANELGYSLDPDNVYGSRTRNAVIDLSSTPENATVFNDTLVNTRINYVTWLTEQDPALLGFLPGWKKRIYDFYSGVTPMKIGVTFLILATAAVFYYFRQRGHI